MPQRRSTLLKSVPSRFFLFHNSLPLDGVCSWSLSNHVINAYNCPVEPVDKSDSGEKYGQIHLAEILHSM